ncbi:MAG: hypothetical protein ACXWT0_17230 [Methylobacter sp.]
MNNHSNDVITLVGDPTPAQIAQVQSNLQAMQAFNDYVYNYSQADILNAYLLLTEPDNSDPGNNIGIAIVAGVFGAIGTVGGPAGAFAAAFVGGLVTSWISDPPASLNDQFSSYITRYQATSMALDAQLATYSANVAEYWNQTFTYNGNQVVLSSLADLTFPVETDTIFSTMSQAAVLNVNLGIWQMLLVNNYEVTQFETNNQFLIPGDENDPPIAWANSFYAKNPAYYLTWVFQAATSGCDSTPAGWVITEYNVGTGAGAFSDGSLNADACNYLFSIVSRETVFTQWGMKQVVYFVNTGGQMTQTRALSMKYLRAMKEGKTLRLLLEKEGRGNVERRILEAAKNDSIFAVNLARRPRQTLEAFLGICIPELVDLQIVVEQPRSYGLIIPAPDFSRF